MYSPTFSLPVWAKRCLVLLLTLCLMLPGLPGLSGLPVTAAAAEATDTDTYVQGVLDKKAALEKAYDIKIVLPTVSRSSVGTATLATLDTCLGYLSADFVRQLSQWYKAETGQKLTFSYIAQAPTFADGSHPNAEFVYDKALINLFIPSTRQGQSFSGSSPVAIMHELGHAYHAFARKKYGSAKLQTKWNELNGEKIYGTRRELDRNKYASAYALTHYDEDFAETFAHAFVCNRAGFSIAANLKKNGKNTVLGNKITFLQSLISTQITKPDTALTNLKKIWSTPAYLSFEGMKLSGNSLEYVGFNAPYNVLKNVLRALDMQAAKSEWKKAVGGWVVTEKDGKRSLVFPGGAKAPLKPLAS